MQTCPYSLIISDGGQTLQLLPVIFEVCRIAGKQGHAVTHELAGVQYRPSIQPFDIATPYEECSTIHRRYRACEVQATDMPGAFVSHCSFVSSLHDMERWRCNFEVVHGVHLVKSVVISLLLHQYSQRSRYNKGDDLGISDAIFRFCCSWVR
jgi:hypothetical protein